MYMYMYICICIYIYIYIYIYISGLGLLRLPLRASLREFDLEGWAQPLGEIWTFEWHFEAKASNASWI